MLPLCQLKWDVSVRQQHCRHCNERISAGRLPRPQYFLHGLAEYLSSSSIEPYIVKGLVATPCRDNRPSSGLPSPPRIFHLAGQSTVAGLYSVLRHERCGLVRSRPSPIMDAGCAAAPRTSFPFSTFSSLLLQFNTTVNGIVIFMCFGILLSVL